MRDGKQTTLNCLKMKPPLSEIIDDLLVRYLAYFNYKSYAQRINLQGNEKILEIGCGGGNLSRFLAERLSQGELVCIDYSEYCIDKAKRRLRSFENIRLELTDFLDFNKENYFDIAVIHYVLHDIIEREKAIGTLRNSLKRKAIVYIREPLRESHGMSSEEIRKLMSLKGFFEDKSEEGYYFPIRGKTYDGVFRKQ